MKNFVQCVIDYTTNLTKEEKAEFARASLYQRPAALFVTCSDSRILPSHFTLAKPGELFTLRNIGNLIPKASSDDCSVAAVLEYAVLFLDIKEIIICGHSECGAMAALLDNQNTFRALTSWLQYAKPSLGYEKREFISGRKLSSCNQLSLANVLQQLDHLATYPFIAKRLESRQLKLHGWWFDVGKATVYIYSRRQKQFIPIAENQEI